MQYSTMLALLAVLTACASPTITEHRALLSEMQTAADRLCEERGGLEVFSAIPEWMDVVTVFLYAGEYSTAPGPVDPYLEVGGPSNFLILDQVSKDQMAKLTRPTGSHAYARVVNYLSTGRIGAIDLLVEGFQAHDNAGRSDMLHNGRLLPDRDLPDGFFRYAIVDAGAPECARFDEMMAAFEKQEARPGYTQERQFNNLLVTLGKCVAITYLGTKDTYQPAGYVYHDYRDDLPEAQVRQYVDDLYAPGGELIARLKNYSSGNRYGYCSGQTAKILERYVFTKPESEAPKQQEGISRKENDSSNPVNKSSNLAIMTVLFTAEKPFFDADDYLTEVDSVYKDQNSTRHSPEAAAIIEARYNYFSSLQTPEIITLSLEDEWTGNVDIFIDVAP